MAKGKKKQESAAVDPTLIAFFVACFWGVCGLYSGEFLYDALHAPGVTEVPGLPSWRAHMGSVCLGVVSFVVSLYFLEELGRKSKILAWRSASPWLPLIALTVFATLIHVPTYVVVALGLLYSVWAYRRTRSVR
jgi:hypothetical protein